MKYLLLILVLAGCGRDDVKCMDTICGTTVSYSMECKVSL